MSDRDAPDRHGQQERGTFVSVDRRLLLTSAAGSGVAMIGMAASRTIAEAPLLATARRVLAALTHEDHEQRLGALGAAAPLVLSFAERGPVGPGTSRRLPRIDVQSARLEAGTFLLDRDDGKIQAIVTAIPSAGAKERLVARLHFDTREGETPRLLGLHFARSDVTDFVVSVADYGVAGDGGADVSGPVQRAYDDLAASGGGTLFFPSGDYAVHLRLTSRAVLIAGAGMGNTRLHPDTAGRPILQALYTSGNWSTVTVRDIALIGTGTGTGFLAGHRDYARGDEYSGRTAFQRVLFERMECCVDRPSGQIGLWIDACAFEAARVHLRMMGHSQPGDPMHGGNVYARDSHFQGATVASLQLSSAVTGAGQIIFENCIFEGNPGYVLHVNQLNNMDATPSLVMRSCWNENNATADRVFIGDVESKPVFASLVDTGMVLFDDTPIGPLRLRNATVLTERCPLDRLTLDADKSSSIQHFSARGFGSYQPAGRVESLAAAYQFLPNRNLFFPMPARQRRVSTVPGTVLLEVEDATTSFIYADSGQVVLRSANSWRVIREVRLGQEVDVPALRWLVWLFQYRLVGGNALSLALTGGYGVGSATLGARESECVAGMTWLPDGAKALSFHLTALDGAGDLMIDFANLIAFESRQAAVDFINSGTYHAR